MLSNDVTDAELTDIVHHQLAVLLTIRCVERHQFVSSTKMCNQCEQ